MNEKIKKEVFKKVQHCLESLVGGSGHLASYSVIRETFTITKIEDADGEYKRFYFNTRAFYESEFTVYSGENKPTPHAISGSIVLDGDYELVRNSRGRVMLEPWNTTA